MLLHFYKIPLFKTVDLDFILPNYLELNLEYFDIFKIGLEFIDLSNFYFNIYCCIII